MKNLKTIATAFLLLFTFTSAFAQTEEETIAWLKEYGEQKVTDSYGYENTFKIDNKNQLYYSEEGRSRLGGYSKVQCYIELKSLKYLNIDDISNFERSSKGLNIGYKLTFSDDVVKRDSRQIMNGKDDFYESSSSEFSFYAESKEKGDQIIKAIVHLAKLYGAKPRPKVSEDMFK